MSYTELVYCIEHCILILLVMYVCMVVSYTEAGVLKQVLHIRLLKHWIEALY